MDANRIIFEEVYEKWSEEKFPNISKSNIYGHKASYGKCKMLHKMKFKPIRKAHMQRIINENEHLSSITRKKIKTLFMQMYDFALENDIVQKNYAQFVDVGEETKTLERKPFTPDEIEKLWHNLDKPYVDTLLIMIYSGMRIGELLILTPDDVNLEERIIIGGIKTKAGKKRAIPIHHKILPLTEFKMNQKYLVESPWGKKFTHENYNKNHFPHDCRHTTATMLNNVGANLIIVKKILGHALKDVTEKVYTHKTNQPLVETINMLQI